MVAPVAAVIARGFLRSAGVKIPAEFFSRDKSRASYFNIVIFTPQELLRIQKELKKVEGLAVTGIRGTSGRNVVRYALGRVGAVARKDLRRNTPTGLRPIYPPGRIPLKRLVKGGLAKGRAGRVLYRAGYIRKNDKLHRFQQSLAVEHGTQYMSAQKHIADALVEAIGPGGRKYRRVFLREFDRRIDMLFKKANANARARRGR